MLLPAKFQIYIRISHLPQDRCLGLSCLKAQTLSPGLYAGGLFGEMIPGNERGAGKSETGKEEKSIQGCDAELVSAVDDQAQRRATPELRCEADPGLSTWQPDGGAAPHRLLLVKGYPLPLPVCRAQMWSRRKASESEESERNRMQLRQGAAR